MSDNIEFLNREGWREYPDHFRKHACCFFKRFKTPTRCLCNTNKDGMQVCVAVSNFNGGESYEIDLCGQIANGTWVKLHQYALPEKIEDGIAMIPQLLAAWELLANSTKTNL